jgi:hypothetical protein
MKKNQNGLSCCPICGSKAKVLEQYRLKYDQENDYWDRIPDFDIGCTGRYCDYYEYHRDNSTSAKNADDAKNQWNETVEKYNKENKKTLF